MLCNENKRRKKFQGLFDSERDHNDGNTSCAELVGCMYRAAVPEPVVILN